MGFNNKKKKQTFLKISKTKFNIKKKRRNIGIKKKCKLWRETRMIVFPRI